MSFCRWRELRGESDCEVGFANQCEALVPKVAAMPQSLKEPMPRLYSQAPAKVPFRKVGLVKTLIFVFKYAILIMLNNHYSSKFGVMAF